MPLHGPFHPASSGKTRQAVILLHGYGADGADLIGLAPYLAAALPDCAFHSPDAPQPCEMSPFGRQWFSLSDYDPDLLRRHPDTMQPAYAAMLDGARQAAPAVEGFIAEVIARHALPGPEAVAVVGFSQGTMMSLHVALRLSRPVAGVVGFSGALLGAEALAAEIVSRPPVLLVHGAADPVVPVQATAMAADALRAGGVEVETHTRPGLEHGIDEDGLRLAQAFLRTRFGLDAAV